MAAARFQRHKFVGVDWSKTDNAISIDIGCSADTVRRARYEYGHGKNQIIIRQANEPLPELSEAAHRLWLWTKM